jgi:PKD repeat protein
MPGPISWPIQDIPFDGVTVGAFTDIAADQFVTFGSAENLDDLGRGRLRAAATSTVLKIGRSSQGVEDGQVDIVDNAWIHVYPDFRVHSKIPVIGTDYNEFKDSDVAVGDLTQEPPPVATLGPDRARRIDATSELARLYFDGGNSYAVADAATIVSYAWDIDDGTFVLGTAATDAAIYADFPAGVRYVTLTVTDSNSKTHTSRRLVLAHDPANSLCVSGMQVQSITRSQTGLSTRLRVLQDLPRADYPDGAHIIVFEDRDPAIYGTPDPTDWSDIVFCGWHSIDEASSTAQETHLRRETQLTCVDVLGRLDMLPGFPQRLEVPTAADITADGWHWGYMSAANMDKFLVYLIHWHSTAASVADFYPSGTWADYPFVLFDASGDTLYNQLQRQAARFVPDHNFTSDRYGRMAVVVNPLYQNPADRTATVQNNITVQSMSAINFGYNRNPRVHTLRGSALLTQTTWLDVGGDKTLVEPVFAIAPGTAPGQGGREQKLGERLAKSQQDLNDCIGHHYAVMNARYGDINVTLNLNADPWDFDPAAFTWVQLITTAVTAPQRGLDFETIRTLCKEVSIDYTYGEEATTWRGRVVLEPETVGLPALTEVHEDALPVGTQPVPGVFVPPLPGDPEYYYGDINAYILWDGAHVLRTWDLQAASPTWELVDTGISGNILDGLYVMVDADTVGMWLLTTDAVWWCPDIMATTPAWSAVLDLATVVAADTVPSSGSVVLKSMFHYWSEPGYLIVATGPNANVTTYPHSYTWHTHDYGQTWTQVDMDAFIFSSLGEDSGYYRAGDHSFNIYRSAPGTIYALRASARIGLNGRTAVFLSSDLGTTWTKGFEMTVPGDDRDLTLLNPFPDADDPSYLTRGNTGGAERPRLYISTDGWATGTLLANPSGYDGLAGRRRVNKRTFDQTHVLAWWHLSAGGFELRESFDQGATWTTLMSGTAADPTEQTPSGWPPDVLQWTLVRAGTGGSGPRIQLTLDNFATMLDREGNLFSVLPGGTWTGVDVIGSGDGFALPRIAPNV